MAELSIKIHRRNLSTAEQRALLAAARGACGAVGRTKARVWCAADPVGKLYHTATFARLCRFGLLAGTPTEYRLTLAGAVHALALSGEVTRD